MSLIRLLIADDAVEFLQSARLMLTLQDDIEIVAMARSGEEAVEFARKFQPDVAVIDMHMPHMDGLAAIHALAKVSPATVCMAISYDEEREIMREAMNAGVREYLVKPFSTDEFVNAIYRLATEVMQRREAAKTASQREMEHDQELWQTAVDYLKSGRKDDDAARVYAELVARPYMDAQILTHLAKIFFDRRDWRNLRLVCERMEKLTPPPRSSL
jgi:YesN/AraC family two-component response regulator